MSKLIIALSLLGCVLFATPAAAVDLTDTVAMAHPAIQPGSAVSVFVPFPTADHFQLATVVGHYPTTTVVYAVDAMTDLGVTIKAYNYGTAVQAGSVVVGFWE